MNLRLLAVLVVLAAAGLWLFLSGGGGGTETQAPDLGSAEDAAQLAAPAIPEPVKRPAYSQREEFQNSVNWELPQPTGGSVLVGADPVPTYDIITGEQTGQVRWMAEPLRGRFIDKVRPEWQDRVKRLTIPSSERKPLRLPGGMGKDSPRSDRKWRRPDETGGSGD